MLLARNYQKYICATLELFFSTVQSDYCLSTCVYVTRLRECIFRVSVSALMHVIFSVCLRELYLSLPVDNIC